MPRKKQETLVCFNMRMPEHLKKWLESISYPIGKNITQVICEMLEEKKAQGDKNNGS